MWILIALLCALTAALADIYAKKNLYNNTDRELVMSARFFYSVPLLWIFLAFTGIPEFDPKIFYYYLLIVPLEICAGLLFIRALQSDDISLIIPLLSFTPAFILISGPLILHEYPNVYGIAGVFLIVCGSYVIHIKKMKDGILAPVISMTKNRASLMMFAAAAIYSLISTLGKICILKSDPFFFAATYYTAVALVLMVYMASKQKLSGLFNRDLFISGSLFALMILLHVTGLKMTYESYLVSVKRASILFSIILGMVFFRERNIAQRFFGAFIMITGILLLSLLGK